jgi:Flp pilus assembly protein TadD
MRFNYSDPFRDAFYHDFTLVERLLSQPRVLIYYAGLIAWPDPSRLSLMHDFPPSRGAFTPWTTLPALAVLLASAGWALRAVERRPLFVFALGWCCAVLIVETSVFPLRLAHEHRLYLPLVGVALAIAGVARAGLTTRRGLVLGVAGLVIPVLAFATHLRNEVWQARTSVWADVIEKSPSDGIGYANLAALYIEDAQYEDALALLERGRIAAPDYAGIPRGVGAVHAARGDHEQALPWLRRAIELDPLDHAGIAQVGIELVLTGRPDEALGYLIESTRIFEHPMVVNYHGKALALLGRYTEAIPRHRRALELAPDDGDAQVALGAALAAVGRRSEARAVLERALAFEDPVGAQIELAGLAWVDGDASVAIARLREAVALRPDSSVALNNLAWMLATAADPSVRNGVEALEFVALAEAQASEPDAGSADTRAAAEASAGQFGRAVETASRAAGLARSEGDSALAREIEERAELYRSGSGYLDPVSRGDAP